ncbi:MAG: hypothetical protein CM15mP89_0260 [Gammaproteobacteria bacterium]|nr:MAG: hypothetical protein CM15mP89_0260 [Gammaproteobacteria bacterium]
MDSQHVFAHCSALAAFLLVLRETVLTKRTRASRPGFHPGHLFGKEILVAHLYLHSDRRLGQYSRRIIAGDLMNGNFVTGAGYFARLAMTFQPGLRRFV